ncbi:MAG: hypothetical protein AB1665_00680 [Candidatus Thermoplasmatota archaeon]
MNVVCNVSVSQIYEKKEEEKMSNKKLVVLGMTVALAIATLIQTSMIVVALPPTVTYHSPTGSTAPVSSYIEVAFDKIMNHARIRRCIRGWYGL